MAGITIGGCAFEDSIDMATGARDCCMFAIESEDGQAVVERGWFPRGGGMAERAISAELTGMSVIFGVTGKTIYGKRVILIVEVTYGASQGGVFSLQREAERLVWEVRGIQHSEKRVRSAVIGVTGAACAAQFAAKKNAVERVRVRLLGGDIGVTGQAARGHPARVPKWGVACGAFRDPRVGGYAVDRTARLCVERTGVEQHAALHERDDQYNADGQRGGNQARRCETPKTRLIHIHSQVRVAANEMPHRSTVMDYCYHDTWCTWQ